MTTNKVVIFPVAFKTIDVFWGQGWTNWSRFEIKYFDGKMRLNLIKGASMPKNEFAEVFKLLQSKKHDNTQTA